MTNVQSAVASRGSEDEFNGEWHVYEPHRVGLPPLGSYFRTLWRRREFVYALARADLRAQHFNTTFGQLWLVLNPALLALVYFMLVAIVRNGGRGPEFLAHLMLCLFFFRLVSTSVGSGARSVVGGGRLILNMAFPRLLLPLEAVLTCFLRFLPTMLIFAIVFFIVGLPIGPHLLWTIPILALFVVFAAGAAMITATSQVYFRDLSNFLTYFTRIWLYTSPILYYVEDIPARLKPLFSLNPLYPMLGALNDVVIEGRNPPFTFLAWSFAWALGVLVAGSLFFISRERDFAIRL